MARASSVGHSQVSLIDAPLEVPPRQAVFYALLGTGLSDTFRTNIGSYKKLSSEVIAVVATRGLRGFVTALNYA